MMNNLEILIKRLHADAQLPQFAHATDAGADLYSIEDAVLQPGERALIGTGIALALPRGYGAFVHPRSGLAIKHGISMVNTPGTIDAGYRGELKVILINHDLHESFTVAKGDRIAQLVIQKVEHPIFKETTELPEADRGDNGFGSTGKRG
jgi:dUTP diphosphatase